MYRSNRSFLMLMGVALTASFASVAFGSSCEEATEVELDGFCYYLDGSGGRCLEGYELGPQSILDGAGPFFAGKDYKTQTSTNCCIWHRDQADESQDFGMPPAECNADGPFPSGPVRGGTGCVDANNTESAQLTLCRKAAKSVRHRCIAKAGHLYCWGSNQAGELGAGNQASVGGQAEDIARLTPVPLGDDFQVRAVAHGAGFTCALSSAGEVKCWGDNDVGQLGYGHTNAIGDETGEMAMLTAVPLPEKATKLALGKAHACAMLESGAVACWGGNNRGQLGLGHQEAVGDEEGEAAQVLTSEIDVIDLAAGGDFSCALTAAHQIRCWGTNEVGQLGQGSSEIFGDSADEFGLQAPPVALGTGFRPMRIEAGQNFACAESDARQLKCWGANERGQLGQEDTNPRGSLPEQLGDNLPPLDFGRSQPLKEWQCGTAHCCAVFFQGTSKCWGGNQFGQLGLGDSLARGDQPVEMGEALAFTPFAPLETVDELSLVADTTCARTSRGWVCFGHNKYFQLGNSEEATRGDSLISLPRDIPGFELP